jgi:hypothetical protein
MCPNIRLDGVKSFWVGTKQGLKMASLEQYRPYFSIAHLLRMVILLVLSCFLFEDLFYDDRDPLFLLSAGFKFMPCFCCCIDNFFANFVHYVMGKGHILIPVALVPNLTFCGGCG